MSLPDLDPEERAAADAAVAALRARRDVAEADARGRAIAAGLVVEHADEPEPVSEVDALLDAHEARQAAAEVEDFEAFWRTQAPGKRLRNVHGRDLALPAAMPLRFEIEARRLAAREDAATMIHLFDLMFGDGTWADLIRRGIDIRELPVLIMWATMNLAGRDATLADALAEHRRMEAEKAAGKAPRPPAIPGGTSPGTGPSSKPTSAASTRSRRRRSRR